MGVGLNVLRRLAPVVTIAASWKHFFHIDWSKLGAELEHERDRWPLWLPAVMGAGIAIYFALPMEPPTSWAVAATLTAVASGFAVRGRQRAAVRVGLSVLAAASLGFAMAKMRTELVAAPILSHRVGPLAGEYRGDSFSSDHRQSKRDLGQ